MDRNGRLCLVLLMSICFVICAARAGWPPSRLGAPRPEAPCPVAVERAGAGVGCFAAAPPGVAPGDVVDEEGRPRGRMAAARLALFAVPLDLNAASRDELTSLDGVGPALADRLIAARPYRGIEELKGIAGFGKKRYRNLARRLFVRANESGESGGVASGAAVRRGGR